MLEFRHAQLSHERDGLSIIAGEYHLPAAGAGRLDGDHSASDINYATSVISSRRRRWFTPTQLQQGFWISEMGSQGPRCTATILSRRCQLRVSSVTIHGLC